LDSVPATRFAMRRMDINRRDRGHHFCPYFRAASLSAAVNLARTSCPSFAQSRPAFGQSSRLVQARRGIAVSAPQSRNSRIS
jgi:hypothetical protein